MKIIEDFIEHTDHYEKEFEFSSKDIVVTINKDEISSETENITKHVLENLEQIVENSLAFINERKSQYEIAFINDFSDPQIFVGEDNFSVYWSSEEGESKGVAVIAADYYWPENKWQGLTIGD